MDELFDEFGITTDLSINRLLSAKDTRQTRRYEEFSHGGLFEGSIDGTNKSGRFLRSLQIKREEKGIAVLRVFKDHRFHFDRLGENKTRLNFFAHGVSDHSVDGMTHININEISRDLDYFSNYIEGLKTKAKFYSIRLVACNSGDGGVNSFAQRLANRVKLPVKGYEGPVLAYPAESFKSTEGKYNIHDGHGNVFEPNSFNAGVLKAEIADNSLGPWRISYKSQWFYSESDFI